MRRALRFTHADLEEFCRRAQSVQKAIDSIVAKAQKPQLSANRTLTLMRIRARQEEHAQLVNAIVIRLKYDPAVAWLVRQNTGTFLSLDGKRRVRCGYKGQLDIVGQLRKSWGGRMLAIEVKTGDSRPTPDQRATIAAINEADGCAFVARSVQQAVNEIVSFTRAVAQRASSS